MKSASRIRWWRSSIRRTTSRMSIWSAFRLHVRGGQDFLDDASLTPVLQRFLNAAALDAEATLWRAVLEQTRRRRWVEMHPARSR